MDNILKEELSKIIFDFMNKSPEHGVAAMDLLGSNVCNNILNNKVIKDNFSNRK